MTISEILILGSGGREHALVEKLKADGHRVECAPGSDAISESVKSWGFKDFSSLKAQMRERKLGQLIVGPELYLEQGISDFFEDSEFYVFGPSRAAAQLETNKAYAKRFCEEFEIPNSKSVTVTDPQSLGPALERFSPPFVVKASGLAAGKGVLITDKLEEAQAFGTEALKEHSSVILEEFLKGEELSCFYAIDGEHFSYLGCAQDHKQLLDGGKGPNTGGMGAVCWPDFVSEELLASVQTEILQKTLEGLRAKNIFYRGFLFLGLMITEKGPKLLEYNCRLGDPETQVLLMKLKTDLVEIINGLRSKRPKPAEFFKETAMNVVVAAKGYPAEPLSDFLMPELSCPPPNSRIFHSGTKRKGEYFAAAGGRLFSVASMGPSLRDCRQAIYPWLESLSFKEQVIFRRDIGEKYARD